MAEKRRYRLSDFSFELPEELIAQYPEKQREESRLMIVHRETGDCEHRIFRQITEYLREGDLLVLNNTRVIPARIFLKRETGGAVEIMLFRQLENGTWLVLSNRTKRLRRDEQLQSKLDPRVAFRVVGRMGESLIIESNTPLTEELLQKIGEYPLPPYIKRSPVDMDRHRYQTVYATEDGAIASPTAGLHFSEDLLMHLSSAGIYFVPLTLYVSWGTFQPVREEELRKHRMHSERYILPADTAASINRARTESRRVIAVGTTVLRVLESTFENGQNAPGEGEADIFIYPPYAIRSADALITNFHTPYSTLLMLVSAFAGYDHIMRAYRIAIEKRYRFYSYGDAMFIV
jgi:S-adenosylmethionine:tRNA ribosyltransferase-isomerase